MNIAPSSDSAAEDMKCFMTWEMVNIGTFHRGTGLYLAKKMWSQAQL